MSESESVMTVAATYDVETLHRLGAECVIETRENGVLTGYEVRPAIELAGYQTARSSIVLERLARLKESRKADIDAEAERQRLRWITPGTGQAMTYARKVEQAKAVLGATDPQPADYPMLAASIGIDGADIVAVATTVIAMDAAWEAIGAAIEQVRLNAKNAVDLAEDIAAVEAFIVNWPEG